MEWLIMDAGMVRWMDKRMYEWRAWQMNVFIMYKIQTHPTSNVHWDENPSQKLQQQESLKRMKNTSIISHYKKNN